MTDRQAQRRRPRGAAIATATARRRSLQRIAASNTDSNLISSPHPREADWYVPICRPAWLHLHPAIIDDLFVQFGHLPAGRERRFRVVGQQVHVRLDCDRLAIGCLEVRAEQGLPLTVRTVEVEVPEEADAGLAAELEAAIRARLTFRARVVPVPEAAFGESAYKTRLTVTRP